MADATLIQGARDLAAAKSGVAPGVAFSAGFDKGQAKVQADLAAQAKAQKEKAKASMRSFDSAIKYQKDFALKRFTGLTSGSKNLTEVDREIITKNLQFLRSSLLEGSAQNTAAREQGDYKAAEEASNRGAALKAKSIQMYDQVSLLENFRQEYLDIPIESIAKLPGNETRMANMNTLISSSWDIVDGALTFEDGTRLIDMELPFTVNIGSDFMEFAGKETNAIKNRTQAELSKLGTITEELKAKTASFFEGDKGLDVLEVLVSNNYFTELNPGFGGINFDRNNPEEVKQARLKATELTVASILSGAKPDKSSLSSDSGAGSNVVKPGLVATVNEMKAFEKEILTNQFTGPRETKSWSIGGSTNPEQLKIKYDPVTNKWTYLNAKKVSERRTADSLIELMTAVPRLFYK